MIMVMGMMFTLLRIVSVMREMPEIGLDRRQPKVCGKMAAEKRMHGRVFLE